MKLQLTQASAARLVKAVRLALASPALADHDRGPEHPPGDCWACQARQALADLDPGAEARKARVREGNPAKGRKARAARPAKDAYQATLDLLRGS